MKRKGTVRLTPTVPYRRLIYRPLPSPYLPSLTVVSLHHNHFLCESPSVHDQLVDVDPGCCFTVGLQDLAIPVRRERAGRRPRGAARQLEVVEILARALQNRHGDELLQHVVNLERHPRPM